jgi:epoxide hydrolase 4
METLSHPALTAFEAIDVKTNGIRLRVRTAGSGDRLALLLHGFPTSWFSWREQIPALARLGYRVWAPDLRGYGDSDKPLGVDAYRMDELLADVAGLIDAAAAREVLLVTHDWGGGIGWEFMGQAIRRVDRFAVLNTPHPQIFRRSLVRSPRQFLRSWYWLLFQLPAIPEWFLRRRGYQAIVNAFKRTTADPSRFPAEVLEVYRAAAAQPGAITAMLNYYRAALRSPPREHRNIEAPTLMIWGEKDKAFGKELTLGTEDHVRDLTIRYLPNASHWVQEEASDTVNAMLESWLTGVSVSDAS